MGEANAAASGDAETEIVVGRDVFVVIERGATMTRIQQFGVEWDGPIHAGFDPRALHVLCERTRSAATRTEVAQFVAGLTLPRMLSLTARLWLEKVPWWCLWLGVLGLCWAAFTLIP